MRFDIITLFPELFEPFFSHGITRRAFESGQVQVKLWNLREFAEGNYRRVDDRPFGGGPGMVMQPDPLWRALQAVVASRHQEQAPKAPVVLFSPQGQKITHSSVQARATGPGAVFICGRYEGIDQRFIDACVDEEVSLGDFVLSGGEIAAMALIDAVARLQPGVLSDEGSHQQDSFNPALDGLLDCPHYTRPETWQGPAGPMPVPDVLMGGNHAHIAQWRRQQQLKQTALRRPDLIEAARRAGALNKDDLAYLRSI